MVWNTTHNISKVCLELVKITARTWMSVSGPLTPAPSVPLQPPPSHDYVGSIPCLRASWGPHRSSAFPFCLPWSHWESRTIPASLLWLLGFSCVCCIAQVATMKLSFFSSQPYILQKQPQLNIIRMPFGISCQSCEWFIALTRGAQGHGSCHVVKLLAVLEGSTDGS